MRAPRFWSHNSPGPVATLLGPLGIVTTRLTAARMRQAGWQAPVPVICCGNVTVGGAGKTILALELGRRLRNRGIAVHFVSRGYGGHVRGVLQVSPDHQASLVGDEPKLLADVAPTWVAVNRAAAAQEAVAAGAQALIMDDGLQNPGLAKDLSLLVIDGGSGFGNRKPLPAGPLREPVAAGAARCAAAVLIGPDATGASALLGDMPLLRAWLIPGPATRALLGRRVVAFAGIARPAKFFSTLEEAGAVVVGRHSFADHHQFTDSEIGSLLAASGRLAATLVTTAKDAVRLSAPQRLEITLADVMLEWQNPELIDTQLSRLFRVAAGPAAPQTNLHLAIGEPHR